MNLDDIIRYDQESTYVDFKREEYRKEKFHALIKDIVSMANANYSGSRYIIIGVDLSNGTRTFPGISGPIVDAAIYQNLVHEKVEPEINLEYYPYEFEGVQLAVMEINGCDNQPYMLKNEIQTLRKGDCFIRKGSTQLPLVRADLDRMIARKIENKRFDDDVEIWFKNGKKTNLEVKVPRYIVLPSDIERKKIQTALNGPQPRNSPPVSVITGNVDAYQKYLGEYKNMSKEKLALKLKNLSIDYHDSDNYYIFEQQAEKINFLIQTTGDHYIEDAKVQITVENIQGLMIAEQEYSDPNNLLGTMKLRSDPDYPTVTKTEKSYVIEVYLTAIKHHIPVDIFEVPLRFFPGQELIGKTITVQFEVFGKNLRASIKKNLEMTFV